MAVHRPRSDLGVVYTPREVCEPMVRRALEPLIRGRSADEILALRVCDPAIGEGAFLIEIVRVLAEAIGTAGARLQVAERCIHGADIDEQAVAAARLAVESFVGAPVPALAEHLRVADALACEWPRFDLVVGNPPYVRQERLGEQKALLRAYETYDGVADLYVYFVELAHRIARRYCLILPNKWMTAAYGRPLRAYLARQASVEGLVDFGRALPLFADADAFPCIVWGTVGTAEPLRVAHATGVVESALGETTPLARDRWRDEPWHIDSASDAALIERWERRFSALGSVLAERPSRGVVTGCNRAFVIDAATRARLEAEEPAAAALIRPFVKGRDVRRWRPAVIDRFILLLDRGTQLPLSIAHYLGQFREALEPRPESWQGPWSGRKPGSYRWYELQDPVVPLAKSSAPRLLYQDIQTAPACSLDESGELVPDTTVWILPSADRFLLAVLNSPLYGWYARRRFPPALNGAVRPKLEYMRALPIATPPQALRAHVEQLVERRLAEPDPALDAAIADAIFEAYELSRGERELVRDE